MTVNSQQRIPLRDAVQQAAAIPLAALVSQQFANGGAAYLVSFTVPLDADRIIADATAGNIVATVPLATKLIVGKPYVIEKTGATNTVTVTFSGTDEYEGNATVVLSGNGESVAFISDGTLIKRAFPSALAGDVPAGALAIAENLADLDDADAALDNLGGTAVGKAVFTAVDAAAGRAGLGLDTQVRTFGPFALDTIAANADAVRFRPGFAGTFTAMVLDLSKTAGLDGTVIVTPTIAAGATTPASAQHAALAAPGNIVDTPITAGGAFTADQEIVLAVTGTNTVAGKTMVSLEYTCP